MSQGAWKKAQHLKLIDEKICDLIYRRIEPRILLIEAPPRHGKSELVSKYLPAWYLGRFPDKRVILASYSGDFAGYWGRHCRTILQRYGPSWFDSYPNPRTQAVAEWEMAEGGGMVACGIGGSITGRGANLLIIDDPIKNDEEALSPRIRERHWDWWQSTASTRLEPGGVVVLMATRWHKDDLSGKLLEAEQMGVGEPICRLSLPAIARADDQLGREPGEPLWPQRWPLGVLEAKRASMDLFWWNALYQQQPSAHANVEWPDEYFEEIWAERWPDAFELSVVAVDASKGRTEKSDYTAIVFVGISGGKLWVDSRIERLPLPDVVPGAAAMVNKYKPDGAAIEATAFQELLLPEFVRYSKEHGTYPCPVVGLNNKTPKLVRIRRLGGPLSQRRVKLRQGNPDNQRLLQQLKDFPLGDFDDGPDALEMAVRRLHEMIDEAIEQ